MCINLEQGPTSWPKYALHLRHTGYEMEWVKNTAAMNINILHWVTLYAHLDQVMR